MDSNTPLVIYGLSAHSGKKFKINLPKDCLRGSVKDLKTRMLHDRKIPVECQTLFLCKGKTQLEALKDTAQVPRLDQDGSGLTLHLYVTRSSQQKSLEKTRKSDFDDWFKRFKELNISPHYSGVTSTAPAAAAASPPAPAVRQPPPADDFVQIRSQTAYVPEPMPVDVNIAARAAAPAVAPTAAPTAAPAAAKLLGAAAAVDLGSLLKSYNSVADNCHLCSRDDERSMATHYCHNCDEYSCVLCENCAAIHPQNHDVELMPRRGRVDIIANAQTDPTPVVAPIRIRDTKRQVKVNGKAEVNADTWICETCTMKNDAVKNYCAICEARKPGYKPPALDEAPAADYNWQCETCTYLNLPYRPSCCICAADRPAGYQIPDDYVPKEEERKFVDGAIASRMALDQVLEEEKRQAAEQRELNRKLLVDADDKSIIVNDETFECPICMTDCEVGDGVKLRECLHTFCRDCLKGHIESSESPEVQCPFVDDNYQCSEAIQEREIREIAADFYPKLLAKSLQVAESQAADSFHCKTLNCPGWCTYDEDVNFFSCPVCGKKNCLTCQAIHEEQNCKEYQDELKRKAEIDDESKKTQEELERLLREHEAMHCPKCKIVIMKKMGCDWIQCSVCKTEICWVTRQARWGPNGAGDTSGGCKCRVNGKPCHERCGNCH